MSDMMPPDIKMRWVAALRSGDYPEAYDQLRTDSGWCALAVLCDVLGVGYFWESQLPYRVTRGRAGISKANAKYIAELSGCRVSHATIADVIEAEL